MHARNWNGFCLAGCHGLDYCEQVCDLCPKTGALTAARDMDRGWCLRAVECGNKAAPDIDYCDGGVMSVKLCNEHEYEFRRSLKSAVQAVEVEVSRAVSAIQMEAA